MGVQYRSFVRPGSGVLGSRSGRVLGDRASESWALWQFTRLSGLLWRSVSSRREEGHLPEYEGRCGSPQRRCGATSPDVGAPRVRHLSQLTAGGMGGADEHGGRQSVIRARSRRNGHQIIIRGSRRSPVPGESERCKTIRRPTAWWRPARIAQALAVGEDPPPSLRRSECGSVYAAAALPSSNTSSQRARSRTTSRRVTAMIARFLPVRGASRS